MIEGSTAPAASTSARMLAIVSRQPDAPAAARRVGAADRDVAELACAVAIALEQLAIEDDPGADPATHPDHDQVVGPRAAKEGQLGEGGRVTVVGDDDRHAVALLEQRPEAELGPVQVDRPADGSRARVDDAGRADADTEEGGPVIGAQGVDELEDELDGGVAVPSFEGQVARAEDLATQVDDGSAELRFAEIEADQVAAIRGDAQQDRRLASAGSAAADLFDQAVVDEAADEITDGRSRQAGQSGQVGARQRAVVVQGAQNELLVERSRLLVRGLLRQHSLAGAHARADAPSTETTRSSCPGALARDLTKWDSASPAMALSSRWTNDLPARPPTRLPPQSIPQPIHLVGQLRLARPGAIDDGRRGA